MKPFKATSQQRDLLAELYNAKSSATLIYFNAELAGHLHDLTDEDVWEVFSEAEQKILRSSPMSYAVIDRDVDWYYNPYTVIRIRMSVTDKQRTLLDLLGTRYFY